MGLTLRYYDLETVMRIGFMVAVLLLLGAQTGPASAGILTAMPMGMFLPCSDLTAATMPRSLCRDLAAVLLGPASGLGLSVIAPLRQAGWNHPAAPSPDRLLRAQLPAQGPGWRAHMDMVVAGYDDAFGAGGTVDVPSAPAILWTGGSPFAPRAAD